MSVYARRRGEAAGFTLLEVLAATGLLAIGLLVVFATLRSAAAVAERGERQAARNETMRATHAFLRRALATAEPLAFDVDPGSGQPVRFEGDPARMRFVSDLPLRFGVGGPHLHELRAIDGGAGLQVEFAPVQGGQVLADPARHPELLADGLREVRFSYRGLTPERMPGAWQDQWAGSVALPVQVRIEVLPMQGDAWPPLLVSLARGDGQVAATTP